MLEHFAIVEAILPIVLAPLLFVGYRRTRALQAFLRDARLAALGRFFVLFAAATVLRAAVGIISLAAAPDLDSLKRALDQQLVPSDLSAPLLVLFWLHHLVVIAAFGGVAWEYARPRADVLAAWAPLAIFVSSVQTVEALLAIVPAVFTWINYRGRHTRRSLHVAAGFLILALSQVVLLALLASASLNFSFHVVVLAQIFALSGALVLVFALGGRKP